MFRCVSPFVTLHHRFRSGDVVRPEHFDSVDLFARLMDLGHVAHFAGGEGDEDAEHQPEPQPVVEHPVPGDKPAEQPVEEPAPVAPPANAGAVRMVPEQLGSLATPPFFGSAAPA